MAAEQTDDRTIQITATVYAASGMKNKDNTRDTGAPDPISKTADKREIITYLESFT